MTPNPELIRQHLKCSRLSMSVVRLYVKVNKRVNATSFEIESQAIGQMSLTQTCLFGRQH